MATVNIREPYSSINNHEGFQHKQVPIQFPIIYGKKKKENNESKDDKLPRIILKDRLGYRLDTFTKYQENIYKAEVNVRNPVERLLPEEWRLPQAPLPSRPDYSRTEPMFTKSRKNLQKHVHPHATMKSTPAPAIPYTGNWAQREAEPRVLTKSTPYRSRPYMGVDVDNVAFVAESLNRLPRVPTLAFLRQEFNISPKEYFNFVGNMYLNRKDLTETDRREAVYHFPGFCTGCQRYYLCYGCDRSSEPHYHLDGFHKNVSDIQSHGHENARKYDRHHRFHLLEQNMQLIEEQGLTPEEMAALEREAQRIMRQKSLEEKKEKFLPKINTSVADLNGALKPDGVDDSMTEDEGIMADRHSMANTDDDSQGAPLTGRKGSEKSNKSSSRFDSNGNLIEKQVDFDMDGSGKNSRWNRYGNSEDDDWERGTSRKTSQGRSSYRSSSHDNSSKQSYMSNQGDTDSDEDSESGSPKSGSSKRRRLYRAPAAFKVKQREKKMIKASSPFSSNRKISIPGGKGFQLRKSDRKPTEFKEFQRNDGDWKAPPKFELKQSDKNSTKFWSPPPKKDKSKKNRRRDRHHLSSSPDSGLDSEKMSDEPVAAPPEMPPTTAPVKLERLSTPSSQPLGTPDHQKRERSKKTRREVSDVEHVERKRTPTPVKSPVPSQTAEEEQEEQESSEIPELPPLELPPLPEIVEEVKKTKKKEVKKKDVLKTQILPSQKLKTVKQPLPRKNVSKFNVKTPLSRPKKRGKSAAEAPVTPEEMKDLQDPLDFLRQYCIIHQERLPFYERIYTNVVDCQDPRYERDPPLSPRTGMPMDTIPEWGEHEMNMFHDMVVISRGQDQSRIGLTAAEQYLEKTCYTLEILTKKKEHLIDDLQDLEANRTSKLAQRGKELVRDIMRPDYVKKEKKGKKKKKKKGNESPVTLLRPEEITDEVVVSRLDDKVLKSLCKEPEIHQLDAEIQRRNEKLAEIEDRMVQLDGERNILGMYCMQIYFMEQNDNLKPLEFRRAQSALYNKLHPHLDVEMNMEELEGALQLVNNNLLTETEYQYLFHILNLPGRRKINFQLFSIVAALSEKVTMMDPFVRKLINKMDYNALATKMDRSKDLFELICDEDSELTPRGNAPASNLALELMAGGLSPEHTKYVLSKFNREGTGYVDFLDFVMYIPLFIEIHERIVKDPLRLPLEVS